MRPIIRILSNGLTVIVQPVPYAPVAAVVVAYRAGSLIESDETRGLSHFCEHMMFKGTQSMNGSRFWQIIQREGGVSNAFTSRDLTAYYTVVPFGRLDGILKIEADRMSQCRFDPNDIETEKEVVLEERRISHVDSPSGALSEILHKTAFSIHPYRHPVIGYDSDILGFTRDSTLAFYRYFYTPSNCVVVLTGKIDSEQALDLADKHFRKVERATSVDISIPDEPAQINLRKTEIRHNSSLERLRIAFHGTDTTSRNPVLDLISMYLAGGRTGRLEELLVQSGEVINVFASNDSNRCKGLFTVGTEITPGTDSKRVMNTVLSEIVGLREKPLPDNTIEELKMRYRTFRALASSSPAGRALELAMGWCMADDPLSETKANAIIQQATAEDMMNTATDILLEDRATITEMIPVHGGFGNPDISSSERTFVPDITPPSRMDFHGLEINDELLSLPRQSISSGVVEEILVNGLRILLREDHTFPLVSLAFSIPIGTGREPVDRAGLAAITVESMQYGTHEHGYMEFNRWMESRGAQLEFGAGSERSTGHLTMLSSDIQDGISMISDLLLKPAFRTDDIALVLKEAIAEVDLRKDMPFTVSLDNLARMMTSPPEMARIPTIETLSKITGDDISAFHGNCARPDGSVIVLVGDLNPDSVLAGLRQGLSDWKTPSTALPVLDSGNNSDSPSTMIIPMRGKTQTVVITGYPAPSRNSDDRFAFHMLNFILGDGIGSRLGRTLRDTEGLAYMVGSEYTTVSDRGHFITYLSTSPHKARRALEAMTGEVCRLTVNPVDPIEIRLAKASTIGRHALGLMHYHNVADYILFAASTGKPLNQDLISLKKTSAITGEQLRKTARHWLENKEPYISLAGGELVNPRKTQ